MTLRERSTEATRRLGITHPIVQGPFGGGLSSTRLTSLVSNLGGLGSFGAHIVAPERIGALTSELRGLTDKPFALNLWVSDHDPGGRDLTPAEFDRAYGLFEPFFQELGLAKPELPARYHPVFEQQIEALLEARPPVFSFVFGVPSAAILAECKRRDIVTVGTATTLAEARVLDAAGVDAIVATGMEAGGHRPSFLARSEDSLMGTLALVPQVADRVRAPVIAAGGIADRRGAAAVLTLGAGAAQIGTAFLACNESGATAEHRAQLFSAAAEHTTLTRTFTGRLARGMKNRWTERTENGEYLPFPLQSWFVGQLKTACVAQRRTDFVSLWAGQIAPNVRHHDAASLMAALLEESEP